MDTTPHSISLEIQLFNIKHTWIAVTIFSQSDAFSAKQTENKYISL